MRFAIFLLLALCAVGYSDEINCNIQRKCSLDYVPICAGNNHFQQTYNNTCIYSNDYCRCHLRRIKFRIIDSTKACQEESANKPPCFPN